MEELINKNKWLFKQFTIINKTASIVYSAIQGGVEMNFYACYEEYQNGVFGWVKENRAFESAIEVYEHYTANDGWDVVSELENLFGNDLAKITPEEITKWEQELSEYEPFK